MPDGTYTVEVTDNTNAGIGCTATATFDLSQFTPDIYVDNVVDTDYSIQHSDDCNPDNGSVTVLRITSTDPSGTDQIMYRLYRIYVKLV